MSSNEQVLRRLFELNKSHTCADSEVHNEQHELVLQLASNLGVQLEDTHISESESTGVDENTLQDESAVEEHTPVAEEADTPVEEKHTPVVEKYTPEPATAKASISSARDKFEEPKAKKTERRPDVRKSAAPPKREVTNSPGGNECDLSDPKINEAYESIRDDSSEINWMLLGYGGSRKALQLYGSGEGGLEEFVSKLVDNEVTFGYVRMTYGDSARSKFVFVTYVPESLSGLSKAKANMHKPSVDQFLKYYHIQVQASSLSDLQDNNIRAKLHAAGGANYGTGGAAPAGSEDFGNVKDNARKFFGETEKKGSVSIKYNKDPLARTTPVSLTGRAGITEKYIRT